MSAAFKPPHRMTITEFLEWEARQDLRHELVDGSPVAMAGGTVAHNLIAGNVYAALRTRLAGSACRPFASDLLTQTGTGQCRYADVTIACGPLDLQSRLASDPRVMFEILSEGSQKRDRTDKLGEYNSTPSVAHYVLIEQTSYLLQVYDRGAHGDFVLKPREIRGLDAVVDLPGVPVSVTMAEIYADVALEVPPPDP